MVKFHFLHNEECYNNNIIIIIIIKFKNPPIFPPYKLSPNPQFVDLTF